MQHKPERVLSALWTPFPPDQPGSHPDSVQVVFFACASGWLCQPGAHRCLAQVTCLVQSFMGDLTQGLIAPKLVSN